jgi:hypothetical protein
VTQINVQINLRYLALTRAETFLRGIRAKKSQRNNKFDRFLVGSQQTILRRVSLHFVHHLTLINSFHQILEHQILETRTLVKGNVIRGDRNFIQKRDSQICHVREFFYRVFFVLDLRYFDFADDRDKINVQYQVSSCRALYSRLLSEKNRPRFFMVSVFH